MATITESTTWDGVYQLEVTDPVAGGPNGVDNLPHRQLANRTAWLREHALVSAVGVGAYTAGDLFVATGGDQLARLPIGASGRVLTSSGTAPYWADNLNLPGSLIAGGARFNGDVIIPFTRAIQFEGGGSTRPVILKNGDDQTELRMGNKLLALRETVTAPTAGPLLGYLRAFDYTTNTPVAIPLHAWT